MTTEADKLLKKAVKAEKEAVDAREGWQRARVDAQEAWKVYNEQRSIEMRADIEARKEELQRLRVC